jgi:hypothetical protein
MEKIRQYLPILFFFSLVSLAFSPIRYYQSQYQVIDWEKPVNLADTTDNTEDPSICVDPEGNAHVVWCARDDTVAGGFCSAIFYTEKNRISGWSSPIDILLPKSSVSDLRSARIACSEDGFLHLAWISAGRIHYSHALATDAKSAKNWSKPFEFSQQYSNIDDPDIFTDDTGRIHMAIASKAGQDIGIYYTFSDNNGESWNLASNVKSYSPSESAIEHPKVIVDQDGIIHLTWTVHDYPEIFPPIGIQYARSIDEGKTWSDFNFVQGPYDFASLTSAGKILHMIWSGTNPDRHKFYRFSENQGINWSASEITLDVGGYQQWSGMGVDSMGRLHLAQPAGVIEGYLTYQVLTNGIWSPFIKIVPHPEKYPEEALGTRGTSNNAQMAIGLGNEMHIVVNHAVEIKPGQWVFNIFYVGGEIDSPAIPPKQISIPTSTNMSVVSPPVDVETAAPERPVITQSAFMDETELTNQPNNWIPLLAGVLPGIALLLFVLVSRNRTNHRD